MNRLVFHSDGEGENNGQVICNSFVRKIFYQSKNFDNQRIKPDKFRLVFNLF